MIVCRSPAELEQMRAAEPAGRARCSTELAAMVAPGVTTADLDALAEQRMRAAGAEPAFKGYRGYPGDDLRVGERARWSTGSRRHAAC